MKSPIRTLALLIVLAGLSVPASAQYKLQIVPETVEVPRGDMLIQNIDTIWTATGTILENASILIRDGIISAIGAGSGCAARRNRHRRPRHNCNPGFGGRAFPLRAFNGGGQ